MRNGISRALAFTEAARRRITEIRKASNPEAFTPEIITLADTLISNLTISLKALAAIDNAPHQRGFDRSTGRNIGGVSENAVDLAISQAARTLRDLPIPKHGSTE